MIRSECSGDYKRLAIAWVTVPDELEVTLRNPNPNENPNPSPNPNPNPTPTLTRRGRAHRSHRTVATAARFLLRRPPQP